MSPMKRRLIEDRAMRDAARELVEKDIAFLKSSGEEQGMASRVAEAGKGYAQVMAEGASDLVREHRGKLSGGIALAAIGLAAWIYRSQLGELASGLVDGLLSDDEDQDDGPQAEAEPD